MLLNMRASACVYSVLKYVSAFETKVMNFLLYLDACSTKKKALQWLVESSVTYALFSFIANWHMSFSLPTVDVGVCARCKQYGPKILGLGMN